MEVQLMVAACIGKLMYMYNFKLPMVYSNEELSWCEFLNTQSEHTICWYIILNYTH